MVKTERTFRVKITIERKVEARTRGEAKFKAWHQVSKEIEESPCLMNLVPSDVSASVSE